MMAYSTLRIALYSSVPLKFRHSHRPQHHDSSTFSSGLVVGEERGKMRLRHQQALKWLKHLFFGPCLSWEREERLRKIKGGKKRLYQWKINTNTNYIFHWAGGGGWRKIPLLHPPSRLVPPQETDRGRDNSGSGRKVRKTREWPWSWCCYDSFGQQGNFCELVKSVEDFEETLKGAIVYKVSQDFMSIKCWIV